MTTLWLIEENAGQLIGEALASGWKPTAAQEAEIEARVGLLRSGGTPRAMQTVGATSKIRIEGVLTKAPDVFAMLFGGGGTSYQEIVAAFRAADQDPSTTSIEAYFDTPGGQVAGLFEAIADLGEIQKPVRVTASQATSAGYALAASLGPIEATGPAATFGSIGIMGKFATGGSGITMRSTESPNKNPDVGTDAGKAEVQAYLDQMYGLFVADIAKGRGTTAEDVTANFGRGSVLLAADAMKRRMIDSIKTSKPRASGNERTKAAETGGAQPEKTMDLKQLKAEHRDVYEAVVKETQEQAIASERDRVTAHLTMGEASGDLKTALAAIKAGDAMTATLQATYMAAGMNKRDRQDKQGDSDEAGKTLDAAAGKPSDMDLGDEIAARVKAELGKVA